MNKDIEKNILENTKMKIGVYNLIKEGEIESTYVKKERYGMKRIVSVMCIVALVSGITIATSNGKKEIIDRGSDIGLGIAAGNGYISYENADYLESKSSMKFNEKYIGEFNIKAKIDNFIMDDSNLNTEFCFELDPNINNYIPINKIVKFFIDDLIIRDDENIILYDGGAGEGNLENFENYCKQYNLEYTMGYFSDKYYNSAISSFISYYNQEENLIKDMINIFSEEYPKSKKLYYSFKKIRLVTEDYLDTINLEGDWNFEVDVPQNMYNRENIDYRVVSCSNEKFDIYSSFVTDTGFEIGLIINNIKLPESLQRPSELPSMDIIENNSSGEEWAEEMHKLNEYINWQIKFATENSPICNSFGDDKEPYIENSNGEQFYLSNSNSTKRKGEWLEGEGYNYYNIFSMTKYDATDKIKLVLHYYGEPVTIELERI